MNWGEKAELTGRAHQLLDYLEALHRLRHPLANDAIPADALFIPSLPKHPAVRLGNGTEGAVLLEVDRVERPDRLPMPPRLVDAVRWERIDDRPQFVSPQPSSIFGHDDELKEVFEEWLQDEWEPWFTGIRPTLDARRLFQRLYDQRLTAEEQMATHETVWVHGVAIGAADDGTRVRLPLFVQAARYELDARSGALRIVATGEPELEVDGFERWLDTFDVVRQIEEEYAQGDDDLDAEFDDAFGELGLSGDAARFDRVEILERIANVIADAELVRDPEQLPARTDHWQLVDIECLLSRPRPVRYRAFFEALKAAIDDGYLPDTWAAILADEPTEAPRSESYGGSATGGSWRDLDQRILSPLPLNEQQQRVLSRIAESPGVTVQGPPGTGKSYTIAALTSHFLAHGLRVLICAEKPQPLRVIREKMPEELQDLCVAVLGDDRAANRQLESSISAINGAVGRIDIKSERRRLDEEDERLDRARRSVAKLRNDELRLRKAEQQELAFDGKTYTPAEAARATATTDEHDWITDSIGSETELPLNDDELAELLALTDRLAPDDRIHHGKELLPPSHLMSATEFHETLAALDSAGTDLDYFSPVGDLEAVEAAGSERIAAAVQHATAFQDRLRWVSHDPVLAELFELVRSSPQQQQRLHTLLANLDEHSQAASDASIELAAHRVSFVPLIDGRDTAPYYTELRNRFATGKGVPRFGSRDLRRVCEGTTIDGRNPATLSDLHLVDLARQRDQQRQLLLNIWHHEFQRFGWPPLDPNRPEEQYQRDFQRSLRVVVGLRPEADWLADQIAPFFRERPRLTSVEDASRACELLDCAQSLFERQRLEPVVAELQQQLGRIGNSGHPSTQALAVAFRQRHAVEWGTAAAEVRRLHNLTPDLERHRSLVETLASVAPQLADMFRTGRPNRTASDIQTAWNRRRLRAWVAEVLAAGDPAEISERIDEAERQERRLLLDVVTRRAWLNMAERTTGAQRSALEQWAQAKRRLGKGTGKYAARHRRVAQQSMRDAQDAVPVWIMSIANAIDFFRPGTDTAFDIVIVDEASQARLDAITALGLGQRVIVVGDDKQISPATFAHQGEAARLQRQYLVDVPHAEGFDVTTSLYDTATRRFPGVIQLTEHFRCLPEIIAFSNDLAYGGTIEPLRERHPDPDWQPVRSIPLPDGYRDGKVNPAEADRVVELVREILDSPKFAPSSQYPDGASIGVIGMIGHDQSKLIQSRLIEEVDVRQLERRRIRVGSPYEFQGDERDVMIISMIDALDDRSRVSGMAATKNSQLQAYNVAASRARDQLIVVHSFEPGWLAETDLRHQLVAFAKSPQRFGEQAKDLRERCESKFELDVLGRLLQLGLRVDAQYPVGSFRIDFTVTDVSGKRAAIECDGDSYHGIEQLEDDTRRQRILERLGWRFARIRASAYYAGEEAEFARLVRRIKTFGLEVPDVGGSGGA